MPSLDETDSTNFNSFARSDQTSAPARHVPEPVPVRKYRYSRLRWRVLVHLIDGVGFVLMWLVRRFTPVPKQNDIQRILIVQLDHLGDAVLTTSMLAGLKQKWPQATIDVLASATNAEVFQTSDLIHQVHIAERNWFERRSGCWAMLTAAWRLGQWMRSFKYDMGIDVRGDILSIFLMVLARIPRRAGWAMGGGGFWLTDVARWVPGRHEVQSRMALLEALGASYPPDQPPQVTLPIREKDRDSIDRHLCRLWTPHQWLNACFRGGPGIYQNTKLVAPLVVVHPGAGTQAKRWPLTYWRRLIGRLREEGFFVAIIGCAEDLPITEMVGQKPGVIDLSGQLQLSETLALLERSALFIGVDSGPAHLAAITQTRSVVLFSGTNRPSQWRPWSKHVLGLRNRVSCSPCHQKLCPLADHACMTGIQPEHVVKMALKWWQRGQKQKEAVQNEKPNTANPNAA